MKQTLICYRWGRSAAPILPVSRLAGATLAVLAAVISGCAGEKPFATINGQAVSHDEYMRMLERQNVVVPGGQPTNAERLVIDQLISNRVILAEATKTNVVPSDDEVKRYYTLQKKLFEAQYPGKTYENALKEQGITEDEIRSDLKVQLAETNLYSSKLNIGQDAVRKIYDQNRNQIGLPPRVQLRLILTAANSPDFAKAKQRLASGEAFDKVAKDINAAALKATGGLLPQATPLTQVNPSYRAQVEQSADGKSFGPIDFQLSNDPRVPPAKAWVKVEKKLPAFSLSFDDAAQIIRKQLVQQQALQPQNAAVRNSIMGQKLQAKFEPTDPAYAPVWEALRKSAEDAGVGKTAAPGSPIGPGGAPQAPGAVPAAPAGIPGLGK